jgi:DNA-binding MarR family transcriptional regulator
VYVINNVDKDLLCAIFKFNKATSQMSNDSFIRMNEVIAMFIIDNHSLESEKSLIASEVGETLCITHSAVSQLLTSLEKKGYVSRNINENDKRQYRFTLTDEGRQVTYKHKDKLNTHVRQIVSRFGENNVKILTQMLNDFSGLLAQMHCEVHCE